MNKREVIAKAEEFCKKHNINQYPVRIASLCSHYDLSVREEYLPENVSGFIVVQKEKNKPKKTINLASIADMEDDE